MLKIVRKQFLVSVSFAMTINKSQGQSLSKVGLYIPRPVFTYGQLYVAHSRVKSKKGLKVVISDPNGNLSNATTNVLYEEVLYSMWSHIEIYVAIEIWCDLCRFLDFTYIINHTKYFTYTFFLYLLGYQQMLIALPRRSRFVFHLHYQDWSTRALSFIIFLVTSIVLYTIIDLLIDISFE